VGGRYTYIRLGFGSNAGSVTQEALRIALRPRRPAPGLVHHSEQGVPYAASEYVDLLATHGIRITMSRGAILTTTPPASRS